MAGGYMSPANGVSAQRATVMVVCIYIPLTMADVMEGCNRGQPRLKRSRHKPYPAQMSCYLLTYLKHVCVYVCMCLGVCACMFTCDRYLCSCLCMFKCVCTCTCVCVSERVQICGCARVCVCLCVRVRVRVCMRARCNVTYCHYLIYYIKYYIYIYIYTIYKYIYTHINIYK